MSIDLCGTNILRMDLSNCSLTVVIISREFLKDPYEKVPRYARQNLQ